MNGYRLAAGFHLAESAASATTTAAALTSTRPTLQSASEMQ